eukprot:scaffold52170_cov63-Phaeocystis_antarctica.AAC.9
MGLNPLWPMRSVLPSCPMRSVAGRRGSGLRLPPVAATCGAVLGCLCHRVTFGASFVGGPLTWPSGLRTRCRPRGPSRAPASRSECSQAATRTCAGCAL